MPMPKCPKGKGHNAGVKASTARRKSPMVKGSSKTSKGGGGSKYARKMGKYGL